MKGLARYLHCLKLFLDLMTRSLMYKRIALSSKYLVLEAVHFTYFFSLFVFLRLSSFAPERVSF